MKCDGTRAENRFRLLAKRTSPFKSAEASVQSTTASRGVHISGSNAGYTMFRCSVKSTDYPIHSPVSPSLPLPCVTVCHHIPTGVYLRCRRGRWRPCVEGSCEYFEHETSPLALTNHTCKCQISHTQRQFFFQFIHGCMFRLLLRVIIRHFANPEASSALIKG